MKRRNAFTLIELLVVISVIAILMAILLPALGRARKNAKRVVCVSQLHDVAIAGLNFLSANDNKFEMGWLGQPRNIGEWSESRPYGDGETIWLKVWNKYYEDSSVVICPETKGRYAHDFPEYFNGTLAQWRDDVYHSHDWMKPVPAAAGIRPNTNPENREDYQAVTSYAENDWICNKPWKKFNGNAWESYSPWKGHKQYWRTSDVGSAEKVPMVFDSYSWMATPHCDRLTGDYPGVPDLYGMKDDDAAWDGDTMPSGGNGSMLRALPDRHLGSVCVAFLDGSSRAVTLKEMYTLWWSKGWKNQERYMFEALSGGSNYIPWPKWMNDIPEPEIFTKF